MTDRNQETRRETDADTATRRARIETAHGDHETATVLARAVRPDNTAEMDTRVEGSRVVTTIARTSTGGLRSTADDYVVNLQTGARLAAHGASTGESRDSEQDSRQDSNHNTDTDRDTSDSNTSDTDTETTHE